MNIPTAISLTKKLIHFKTMAENGEYECAHHVGNILENNGFEVKYYEFAERRTSLVAIRKGNSNKKPLVFTGHIDVVPLGEAPWQYDPFNGETDGDKLYGRGSSDMKSGIAAFVVAVLEHCMMDKKSNIKLIITAGEETGCDGAKYLTQCENALGEASAIIVGEPTNNEPFLGHRGALWVDIVTKGKTAHGSMPQEGVNAIYKAVNIIEKIKDFNFPHEPKSVIGCPTLNVSEIKGGLNMNSVPDFASFCVDFRTVPGEAHDELLNEIKQFVNEDFEVKKDIDLSAVQTDPDDPWVRSVIEVCESTLNKKIVPGYAPFFTDASIFQSAFNHVPTVILGPGVTEMAHKTDEYVLQSGIEQCVNIYKDIMKNWEKS